MYGKFENGRFVRSPYRITEAEAIRQGFKPVVLTPAPETDDEHYPVEWLEETETEIIRHWNVEEIPADDDIDEAEAFNIIFGGDFA
jgi:hypothetical protein